MTSDDVLGLAVSSWQVPAGAKQEQAMFGKGFWGKGGPVWKGCEWLQASRNGGSGRSEHGGSLVEQRGWEVAEKAA